jgi:uncharacterized protein (TIGR00730 family)
MNTHRLSLGQIKNICVYCGSGSGINPKFAQAAKILGASLANNGIGLVYGGGSLGLMGEVARATLDAGGHVTGIIPGFLSEKEHMLREVQELIVTDSMHERKQYMFARSDAFVALPGGAGTLDELIEQVTWSQLNQHNKPIIIANIDNYWQPLLELLRHMSEETFIRPGLEVSFKVVNQAHDIVPTAIKVASTLDTLPGNKTFPAEL